MIEQASATRLAHIAVIKARGEKKAAKAKPKNGNKR
jgi:hypothetical protein